MLLYFYLVGLQSFPLRPWFSTKQVPEEAPADPALQGEGENNRTNGSERPLEWERKYPEPYQVPDLTLLQSQPPWCWNPSWEKQDAHASGRTQYGMFSGFPHWPVALVQLDHLIFQFFRVVWREAELADVIIPALIRVIVSKLWLDSVGAQQGQSDKGAGQPSRHDVISQL